LASRRAARKASLIKSGIGMAVLVLLILLWQGIIRWRHVPVYTAPAPSDIFLGLKHKWGIVERQTYTTAVEAIAGFGLGTAIAVLLALSFLYLPPLQTGLMPVAIAVSTVPIVAIAPILILIFGQGMLSKVVMTSMISFFPTLINLTRGLEAVDRDTLDLFRVYDATRRQLLVKVRVPTARPYFFAALRVTSTAAVIGAIVAEWINSERGLGFMIITTTFNFDAVLLWGTILVAVGLATAFFLVVVALDKLSSQYVVH
jgi:NitT/TauT family transport system permease protein